MGPARTSLASHRRTCRTGAILLAGVTLALAACSSPNGNVPAPAGSSQPPGVAGTSATAAVGSSHGSFTSARWHFEIGHPADWQVHRGFQHSYLQSGTWKTYAPPDSRGTAVVALAVPGSDDITSAEVRIGASHSPDAVRHCAKPPQSVRPGSLGHVTINGIRFTRFEAADAAMSHHLDVHSYRTVHDGVCYAIDLLVYGTNPEVYSPPATPPFTRAHAFAQMQAVLQQFRFTAGSPPANHATASAATASR